MKELKVLVVAGTRPNFVKVRPLLWAMNASNSSMEAKVRINAQLVHTGQHYDDAMSEIFFRELEIRQPSVNLEAGSGSHAVQTARIMTAFETVCVMERPDWVVVVGDVNSTLACTLVCSKMRIKVAHVEAGLRSFDRTMPEEINRLVTDALGDLLLTPSEDASNNLAREGVAAERIRMVGNVMIDTLIATIGRIRADRLQTSFGLRRNEFVYVTLHRPSNVDTKSRLTAVMEELRALSRQLVVVFPMHPRTRRRCEEFGISVNDGGRLRVLPPLGYEDSLSLTENARMVLTDSGGLQEESTFFRTPCLTLRANTERPVTVSIGSNKLTSLERLSADISDLLRREPRFGSIPPLWDGRTADRVVEHLIAAA